MRAGVDAGVDLFIIETMTDLAEIKAAVLACRENSDLPVFATMTFEEDGRTFLGTSPEVAAITLDAIGADVPGINCSQGPAELRGLAARMLTVTDKPVMVQANAGLPRVDDDGNTVFDIQAPEYAEAVAGMIADGVSVVGGCCGTTPAHMAALRTLIDNHTPSPRRRKPSMSVTSAQTVVDLPCDGHKIAVIGERINPTGKKRLQQALRDGDLDYVVSQGISQQEQGADILDVNVGLPEIDEVKVIQQATEQLQGSTLLPLQIDSTDPAAVEAAVRRYAGKPIINSVNGKQQIMDEILPLVAHYGTNVVGLTLDEGGIPDTAEAARVGFDTIKRLMPAGEIADKGKICVATVKGDIHDIGKNIVKMLLDNYGYTVFDLGRDVDPQEVLKTVRERDIKLVGLSALMTTTVVAMEETIKLLHAEVPGVKIIVGGAVLTPEYAKQIGADYYAKDAAESARIAEEVFGQ